MEETLDALLSKGLAEGYAGSTERQTAKRGPFVMEVSHYITPDGGIYHDEWIADVLGGGQEIVQIGDKKQTRVYAGGTISPDELNQIGLTKKDVTNHLKKFIREAAGLTRVSDDYAAPPDGDWDYEYRVQEKVPGIPLEAGLEVIRFKGQPVFAHWIVRSPVV